MLSSYLSEFNADAIIHPNPNLGTCLPSLFQ